MQEKDIEKPLRKKRKVYVGDLKECDVISEKENYVEIINTTIAKKSKQIKILQQKNRRLIKKIKDLHLLVDDLKNKHMITEDVAVILSVCINYNVINIILMSWFGMVWFLLE